jgi:hypothetical protein
MPFWTESGEEYIFPHAYLPLNIYVKNNDWSSGKDATSQGAGAATTCI